MRHASPESNGGPTAKPQLEAGTLVEGFRLERAVSARPGLYTLAAATGKDGERVTLKLLDQRVVEQGHRRRMEKLKSSRASVKHPNLVPLVRVSRDGELVVLGALPEGAVTLEDRLAGGEMDPAEATRILSQVAGALETARKRGLIHRELAPAAIILSGAEPPDVLLTDFGVTVAETRACERVGAIDDADYRSPEEILGKSPDARSNVYSLACILVECLTGSPPYPYDRPLLAHHAHLAEPPPRVTERKASLAPALDEVVAKAMAKVPEERYNCPGVFMRAVQHATGVQAPIPIPSTAKRPAVAPAPKASQAAPKRVPRERPAKRVRREKPATAPPRRPTAPPAPKVNRRRQRQEARRERRRERRAERRAATARSKRRARRLIRLAPTWTGIFLVVSASAGFATGNVGGGETAAPAGAESASLNVSAPSTPAKPVVAPAIERLDARRTAARKRLSEARRPTAQAQIATDLAAAYRAARSAVERSTQKVTFGAELRERLAAAELAYRQLARAARGGSSDAWVAARDEALDRERDLELLLRVNRWI